MNKRELWPEDTSIEWWNAGRKELNKVIRKYNKWVDKHQGNISKSYKLLGRINRDLMKDYSNKDRGGGWREELLRMEINVINHIESITLNIMKK